ncbi:hypothetical protein Csa_018905, partial [Cucumis sativus]
GRRVARQCRQRRRRDRAAGLDGGCERRTWRLLLHTVARLRRRQNKTRKRLQRREAVHGDANLDRAAAEGQRRGLAVQIWKAADLDAYGCFAN